MTHYSLEIERDRQLGIMIGKRGFVLTYFDLLESEGAFADIVVGHKGVIDHYSWLKEEVIFAVRVLVKVWLFALLSRHATANSVLAHVELSIVSDKF